MSIMAMDMLLNVGKSHTLFKGLDPNLFMASVCCSSCILKWQMSIVDMSLYVGNSHARFNGFDPNVLFASVSCR